jgi:hypothetical protein
MVWEAKESMARDGFPFALQCEGMRWCGAWCLRLLLTLTSRRGPRLKKCINAQHSVIQGMLYVMDDNNSPC